MNEASSPKAMEVSGHLRHCCLRSSTLRLRPEGTPLGLATLQQKLAGTGQYKFERSTGCDIVAFGAWSMTSSGEHARPGRRVAVESGANHGKAVGVSESLFLFDDNVCYRSVRLERR